MNIYKEKNPVGFARLDEYGESVEVTARIRQWEIKGTFFNRIEATKAWGQLAESLDVEYEKYIKELEEYNKNK